jgi:hypothetical protein
MDTKTEKAIAPLVEHWRQREAEFYQQIIEWAASASLSPDQANALINMVRDSRSSIDVHGELATFAAILMQPAITN